jgi:putative addiction module component (TIGR02574 family)
MSERVATLLAEALKLSEDERADLADQLYDSIEGPSCDDEGMTDEEFKAELDRRHEEFLRDPSVGIPWDEVKRVTKID